MTATRHPDPVSATPRMRRAVRIVGSVVAGLILAVSLFRVLSAIAYDDYVVDTSYPAAEVAGVELLAVDNSAGHTEVRGAPGGGVQLSTEVTDGLFRARHDHRIQGDRLRVDADCPVGFATRCRVDHRVTVPDRFGVEARGRFGDVTVTGITGPVDVDGGFGRVELTGLAGSLRVRHGFGTIEARGLTAPSVDVSNQFGETTLVFATAPTDVRVDAQFGATVIELPDDGTAYRVTGAGDLGNRSVEVRTDPSSERSLHVDHQFGDLTIRYTR